MNKKAGAMGVIVLWGILLLGTFIVTLMYVMMAGTFEIVDDVFGGDLTGDYATTWTKVTNAWHDWPVYCYVGFIITGLIGSFILSRDSYTYN